MLPASAPIAMITAQFFSQLMDSPNGFQGSTFKVSFYLALTFYFLILTLTAVGILFLFPHFSAPTGLMALSLLSLFGVVLLLILYKSKKYFLLIIALSITQIITLTSLSGESLSYFKRYPMKKFSNHIQTDPQLGKRIGLYRLGNHRARMGVMTGLPSIYLKNPEELKLFIESKNNIYVVMRQSDLQSEFHNLPMTTTSTDTAWKKFHISKEKIALLLRNGLKTHLQEYSERYVLLKVDGKPIE
jgi:sRNA-binding regulator protein Hfq